MGRKLFSSRVVPTNTPSTKSTNQYTLDQIHKQVPGAPVVPKPVNHRRLAEAVGAVL
jgi:hypothetical protein